ncbi:hypothetical protein M422DRAFT_30621 [Sphaerobolus stellatus SS14]|uniref:Phosphatidic acid phosphatase type 2/haloperoxidase domain-containing protein n=1 Tax=Sphaerobolus stellatus (strain SS14) TaxID=990650 RepID=A0A0C9VZT4_SPHS4|nr:hypothetical protein M422DRAFT_30621 [Sphaerobolus stellatus SS14]
MSSFPRQSPPSPQRQDAFFSLDRERQRQPVNSKYLLQLVYSYAPDWVLTVVVAGLFFLFDKIDGFKREFSLNDTSLQHSFAVKERITDTSLVLICTLAPIILIAIINLISIRSWWDLHVGWLGLILSLGITGSITNVIKVTVGRPRPDVIDRCQPIAGAMNNAVFGLVNATICTQTDSSKLNDGFRSFPSGHSSLSFAGLGFLFFYLAGKLHLFDKRGHTLKAWIAPIPLVGAALVAISRTMDYRHHWHDVLIGGLLGFILSWFSYRQYFPPLSDRLSHHPYSPRIKRLRAPLMPYHHGDASSPHEYSSTNDRIELHRQDALKQQEPISLTDMWREGEEQEILPPGQEPSRPLLGDERV